MLGSEVFGVSATIDVMAKCELPFELLCCHPSKRSLCNFSPPSLNIIVYCETQYKAKENRAEQDDLRINVMQSVDSFVLQIAKPPAVSFHQIPANLMACSLIEPSTKRPRNCSKHRSVQY